MAKRKTTRKRPAPGGDFLTAAKGMLEVVPVEGLPDGLGINVYVRPLTAREYDRLMTSCLQPGKALGDDDAFDSREVTMRVIGASVVDADGERLIPEGREAEIEDLGQDVFQAISSAALAANGMDVGEETPPGNA